MGSSAALRSFHYPVGTVSQIKSKQISQNKLCTQGLTVGQKFAFSTMKQRGIQVSSAKSSEALKLANTDDGIHQESSGKKALQTGFPSGFEALVLEVCDETEVAELKLKVGDFEMHLKRNVGATKAPLSSISPTTPPPIPSEPMIESATAAPPPPPSKSPEKTSPFINVPKEKSSKLAALGASGSKSYVLVSSPTVGSFRRGRTVKGKKQPPICKEGDIIKEGQVIGYLDQFGTELPVKSDVAGEVLKLLFADGEPVGYGDPLIAVLPSFHGIK